MAIEPGSPAPQCERSRKANPEPGSVHGSFRRVTKLTLQRCKGLQLWSERVVGQSDHHDDVLEAEVSSPALGRTFSQHQAALRSYFAKRVRSGNDLEDYVQDVFLRVLAGQPSNRPVQNWPALLHRVAASVLIDRFRRDKARLTEAQVAIDAAETVSDEGLGSPERSLEARRTLERLERELASLDPLCRQAFRLVRVDGLSYKEAGEELGVAPVVIGRQIEKALAKLTKARIRCD